MADFPEHGRSGSGDGFLVFILIVWVVVIIGWILSIIFMIHGVATKDLWEVITGVVVAIVLFIISRIGK